MFPLQANRRRLEAARRLDSAYADGDAKAARGVVPASSRQVLHMNVAEFPMFQHPHGNGHGHGVGGGSRRSKGEVVTVKLALQGSASRGAGSRARLCVPTTIVWETLCERVCQKLRLTRLYKMTDSQGLAWLRWKEAVPCPANPLPRCPPWPALPHPQAERPMLGSDRCGDDSYHS